MHSCPRKETMVNPSTTEMRKRESSKDRCCRVNSSLYISFVCNSHSFFSLSLPVYLSFTLSFSLSFCQGSLTNTDKYSDRHGKLAHYPHNRKWKLRTISASRIKSLFCRLLLFMEVSASHTACRKGAITCVSNLP